MSIPSKINPLLTLEYIQKEAENKYFDRKSSQIRIAELAPDISAFANADGGTLVIGIGDKSKEMLGENLRNLEYAKGSRHFEDEINQYAAIEDLDDELLDAYKNRIGAEGVDTHQVLTARGFIQKKDGAEYLTNAAVLLFAKNIMKFNMNCRIRFIRVDGREMQVGANYNVVKDKSIDEPILRLVDTAKAFIADQLRDFTRQEHGSGRLWKVRNIRSSHGLKGLSMPWHIGTMPHPGSLSRSACLTTGWKSRVPDGSRIS